MAEYLGIKKKMEQFVKFVENFFKLEDNYYA